MIRLDCSPDANTRPWNQGCLQRSTGPVSRGDTVFLRVWLRSPESCPVCLTFEPRNDPHKMIERVLKLTPTWQEFRFVGQADRDIGAGESQVNIWLGYRRGLVEMTGFRLENYGAATGRTFDQTKVVRRDRRNWLPRKSNPNARLSNQH